MSEKEYIERVALVSILYAKSDMAMGTTKAVFASVAKMVELLPAADVVEVRHGEYVYDDNKFPIVKCSVCGLTRNCETEHGWNYCPYCGAKMDGGRKNQI